jgi:site-specific recombinase XerD
MSTLRLEEAMQLVLRYYSGNGYSKNRLKAARKVLSHFDEVLSQGTFSHDMEGIEKFILQQGLTYNASCDLRHLASKVFGLMNYQKLKLPSYAQSTAQATIYRIRHFIKYLILADKVSPTLLSCMQSKVMQKEQVTTILTDKQRLALLNLPNPKTVGEARDSAVILCALRLGLRKSDIHQLMLTEIDWGRQRISLVQRKTRQPLVLPLPQDVGNAIANYILHFRPECPSAFVFISLNAPYRAIIGKDIVEQKLESPPASKGYHILRRTCATSLLNNGIGAQTIMNVLGHVDPSSLDCYLSLDKNKMELTSLGLAAVGLPEVLS